MEVTITLTEKELKFLQEMIEEDKLLEGKWKRQTQHLTVIGGIIEKGQNENLSRLSLPGYPIAAII